MRRIKFSPTLGHLTNFCTNFYEFFNFGKFVKIRDFFAEVTNSRYMCLFYNFCGFWSVAVNTVYKLQYFYIYFHISAKEWVRVSRGVEEPLWCCTYLRHRWSTLHGSSSSNTGYSHDRPSRCVNTPLMNVRSQYTATRQASYVPNHCRSSCANTDQLSFTFTYNT